MKKKIYIFPGWEDKASDPMYIGFENIAKEKDLELVKVDIDWIKPLSQQIFEVEKDSILFGFSLGAIMAWLIAQEYECEKLILASSSEHNGFRDEKLKPGYVEVIGEEMYQDIALNLKEKNKAKSQYTIYGDKEDFPAEYLVKDTDHELNANYFDVIKSLI